MQQLARAAGVSTATLYRWWDTKEAIMLDAFFEHVKPALCVEGGGSPLERFRYQVVRGASWIQSPDGKVATRLIGDVQDDGKLHQLFLERFYLPRRSIYVNLMKEAIAAGELRPGTNIDLLIDVLHGPIYFRAILGHAAPDRAFVTELVDQVLPAFTS
jgi:AcrR family transcriptional regulator